MEIFGTTTLHGRRAAAAAGLALALLAAPARAADTPALDGTLQIEQGALETSGQFGRAGVLIAFSARADAGALTVRLDLSDVSLEAQRDALGFFYTGHGRALTVEQKKALTALARQLAAARPRDKALARHDDLLQRAVALFAEAPVGLPLDDRRIGAPFPGTAPPGSRRASSPKGGASAAACYVGDNDGITFFSCPLHPDVVCHDADNGGHCWSCEQVNVGCGGNCLAECGPGCFGTNAVTWDCGDHDRCCQVHGGCLNPFDSNCGDEYFEAADDFVFAPANCPGCGGI